jgi:hypothetical protein
MARFGPYRIFFGFAHRYITSFALEWMMVAQDADIT